MDNRQLFRCSKCKTVWRKHEDTSWSLFDPQQTPGSCCDNVDTFLNVIEPVITTIYGIRNPSDFEKKTGVVENENEYTTWIEYWDGPTLVHRSAHVTLKKIPQDVQSILGEING